LENSWHGLSVMSGHQLLEWVISFDVMPPDGHVGNEREVIVRVRDFTAPEALIRATRLMSSAMNERDGFHGIHVGRAEVAGGKPGADFMPAEVAEPGLK